MPKCDWLFSTVSVLHKTDQSDIIKFKFTAVLCLLGYNVTAHLLPYHKEYNFKTFPNTSNSFGPLLFIPVMMYRVQLIIALM